MSIEFRWLGTAGIELRVNDQVLVVDPYLTRVPGRKLWLGRVHPNRALIAETIRRCDVVLVTHAHFDHLMDVPDVVRNTGAMAYGSSNSCQLLAVCGVSADKICEIHAGDTLELNGFQVEIRQAEHKNIPGSLPRSIKSGLMPPLRARDYCMDDYYNFVIAANGVRILTDPGIQAKDAVAADMLLVYPGMDRAYYQALLKRVRPRVVAPLHWDNFFRPLSEPLQPYWKRPRLAWSPLQRLSLAQFRRTIEHIAPETQVLEPQIFRPYDLMQFT